MTDAHSLAPARPGLCPGTGPADAPAGVARPGSVDCAAPLPAKPRGSAPGAPALPALSERPPCTGQRPQLRQCEACTVRRGALFGVLPSEAIAHLRYQITELSLQPGQQLYQLHDAGQSAYTVRQGMVRLERCSARGERRVVRLAGPGDLVGLEAVLGQTYAADAVACTPVAVCRLPRALLDDLLGSQQALQRDLMKRWQAALDEAEEWLTELSSGDARWRMLRLLLKLSEYGSADGLVWLPARPEMSAMLGITVETASRLVAALKREGIVQTPDARHARLAMPALLAALRDAGAQA